MKMKTLVILEVSRKQDYIFSSKRLRDNVRRSAEINHVTSEAFFQKAAGKQYHPENMVYSGGGHTILQFESREQAVDFTRQVTEAAIRQYPHMELFAKVMEYQNNCTPGENLKNLSAELERKKSFRKSSIRQLTLGVEAKEQPQPYTEQFFALDALLADSGRKIPSEFSELAGEDNFIAVVHIDGNAMGKRVERIYQKVGSDWENCCKTLRSFSEGIQSDFETAFRKMVNILLQKVPLADNQPLPIRPIILAGDDVCFVTAGKIGLEAARVFLEQLSGMQNAEDGGYYAACAGVAMVHIKYPFHRAYQLSEQLCSSAKVFGSGLDADGAVSAIDWHIEFGQLKEGLSDIRADYRTEDGKRLNLRPLFVCGPQECEKKADVCSYEFFKALCRAFQQEAGKIARSKLKQLRGVLKQGQLESEYYLHMTKTEDLLYKSFESIHHDKEERYIQYLKLLTEKGKMKKEIFQQVGNEKICLWFDALEMADHCEFWEEG